jgi:hypothetical protein
VNIENPSIPFTVMNGMAHSNQENAILSQSVQYLSFFSTAEDSNSLTLAS